MNGRMRGAGWAVTAACVLATPAMAEETAAEQEAAESAPAGQSVTTYPPDYFTDFNPANALDMLSRIPGFGVNSGGNARGFGQNAGNVLINGERPSAKSQTLTEILQRIPVGDVVRIDLVRGGAPGIDMGGRTIVANVIRSDDGGVSGTWRQQTTYSETADAMRAGGEATASFTLAGAALTAALSYESLPSGGGARQYILNPAGQALQYNETRYAGSNGGWTSSLTGERDFSNWTLRLNGRYEDGQSGSHSALRRISGLDRPLAATGFPGIALRSETELGVGASDFTEWEIGGDVERELAGALTLKVVGVRNGVIRDNENSFSTFDGARGISDAVSLSDSESGESVVRPSLTWAPNVDFSLEAGTEGAFNYLESVSAVPSAAIPVSETRIEELRVEPFVTARWRARSGLTLNAALQAEGSRLRQTGFADRERSFFFPKGSASMIWAVRPRIELRASASHSVDQLDFFDFQRSVSLSQATQDQGNPDLVPQQTSSVGATVERRFFADGVMRLGSTRFWVTDVQDRVPLGGGQEGLGNIGAGDGWVVSLSLDAPLDELGAPNSRLQFSIQEGDYRVTDPLTGARRAGAASYGGMSLSLRKDHPAAGISWGFSYSTSGDPFTTYRVTETYTTLQNRGGFSVFAETTRFFGAKTRLSANQLGNFYYDQYRYRYDGQRDLAPLAVTHWDRQQGGYSLELRITGDF